MGAEIVIYSIGNAWALLPDGHGRDLNGRDL